MLAYTPVVYTYMEISAKISINRATTEQFIHENFSNNVPVRRIAFAGSYTGNPFRYQQLFLRQIRILRGGQPIE